MENGQQRIVIIGGGFAGVELAKTILKSDRQTSVTLVDKNNYNFFPPLLYQLATGLLDVSNISYPFRKHFRKFSNFSFRMGKLLAINQGENTISLDNGALSYTKLIIATGTTTNYFGNENIRASSLPMKTIGDAILLKNTILERYEQASRTTDAELRKKLTTIVIAGGGPTGVEIAGMLSALKKNILLKDYPDLRGLPLEIHLLDGLPSLLSPMSTNSQQYAKKSLQQMGVKIKLGQLVQDYVQDKVLLADGSTIVTKNLIWTAGVTAMAFEGLPENAYGRGKRLIVDQYNRLVGYENIYAIGDTCIATHDQAFAEGHPQLAQVAIQQGKRLAGNLKLWQLGKEPIPFAYRDKGSMAIISRNKAVVDLDGPVKHFHGFIAWLVWLFVHLMSLISMRNRITTLFNWLQAYATKDQPLRMIVKPSEPIPTPNMPEQEI